MAAGLGTKRRVPSAGPVDKDWKVQRQGVQWRMRWLEHRMRELAHQRAQYRAKLAGGSQVDWPAQASAPTGAAVAAGVSSLSELCMPGGGLGAGDDKASNGRRGSGALQDLLVPALHSQPEPASASIEAPSGATQPPPSGFGTPAAQAQGRLEPAAEPSGSALDGAGMAQQVSEQRVCPFPLQAFMPLTHYSPTPYFDT